MKFSSILTAKSLALASALVFSAAGAVHAQGYDSDKDDGMQKPGDSTQYPGTSGGSDYGTSGTDQRRRDDRTDGSSGEGMAILIRDTAVISITACTTGRVTTAPAPNSKVDINGIRNKFLAGVERP